MNRNPFGAIKILAWLIFALGVLLLIVFPLVASQLASSGKMPFGVSSLVYITMAQTIVMRISGVVWIFFLGSCFASFLNVVAWRIPRGRGINGSSHCPFCNVKLSFRDNIPIVGWLRNAGRCATCRLPISPRYLIVEIILGAVFLLIASVELLGGGWNLPLRSWSQLQGFEYIILDPPDDLIQITLYHLVLTCALFTFVLIRIDKFRIPVSVYITALGFGLILPLIWPDMLLVPWNFADAEGAPIERFSVNQGLTLLTGMLGGVVCGGLMGLIFRDPGDDRLEAPAMDQPTSLRESSVSTVNEFLAGFSLIGVFLGWQSAISVMILFSVVSVFGLRFTVSARIFVAMLVHLLIWRWLTGWFFWPGPTSKWYVAMVILTVFGFLAAYRYPTTSPKRA